MTGMRGESTMRARKFRKKIETTKSAVGSVRARGLGSVLVMFWDEVALLELVRNR